ncbi:hypothetical protein Hanom_Chr04g00337351 [Helianthus anomalus]
MARNIVDLRKWPSHASLERRIMRGMRPSSTGCVFRGKPNKRWRRGYGMRPSSTRCVLQAWDASLERNPIKMDTWPRDASLERSIMHGMLRASFEASGKIFR